VAGTLDIVFAPSGRRGTVPVGTTVLDAARSLGVDIDSVCGGRAICGRCQVAISPDEPGRSVSPPGPSETTDYRPRRPLAAGNRLSCQVDALADLVIDVPASSQVHRQVVRKRAEVLDIEVDPVVRLYYVEVAEPDMHRQASDLRRLREALAAQWSPEFADLSIDPALLGDLQSSLRQGKWAVTVAVHDNCVISAVWPGFRDVVLGVAFDVGSTTVAGHLVDLLTGQVLASAGMMNPQIRYGEDLMSRVSYSMMHPGGAADMTAAVRAAVNSLIEEMTTEAGAAIEEVLELTFVGNPIMHHLLLGIDPRELGVAPFALAVEDSIRVRAEELGVHANPGARAYVLPCVAGHVGADAAAAALSEAPHKSDDIQLLVDVGTNAEILLGSRDRLLAASSPTGPAFEGAQISSGQRAAPGAIERVRIDRDSLDARYRVIGSELWSDDPGFAASIESFGVTGICGSGIIEAVAEMFLAGIVSADGVIGGVERSDRIVAEGRTYSYMLIDGERPIRITQPDVRAIQLAKAALYAGVRLLMDRLGVDHVDEVRLAGAFGSHIDPTYAMVLGLIPDCELDHVHAAGNAAGSGAMIALLSGAARAEVEALVRTVEKIETAIEPSFQAHFVAAMGIPHASHPFARLAESVPLPGRRDDSSSDTRRRRNRRRA